MNIRKPWPIALISFVAGPVFGMLLINRGLLAIGYSAVSILLAVLPWVPHSSVLFFQTLSVRIAETLALHLAASVHAYRIAQKTPIARLKWYAHGYSGIGMAGGFLVVSMLFRIYAYEPFSMPSTGMVPTLAAGDVFFICKFSYHDGRSPQRGDIAAFRVIADGKSATYIKRVVGLPGDTIRIGNGTLFVNDILFPTLTDAGTEPATQTDGVYPVPSDVYYVVGDNRSNSLDSRNKMGFIPRDAFIGKAVAVFWNAQTHRFTYRALNADDVKSIIPAP